MRAQVFLPEMARPSVARAPSLARGRDGGFYTAVWIAAAVLVLGGFGRTYFLRTFFQTRALPLVLHLHGALMTTWFVLFLVQARLVAAQRMRWHRWLGGAAVFVAPLMVGVGVLVSVRAQRLGHRPHSVTIEEGLYGGIMPFLVFGVLVAAALLLRGKGDSHKRLMLLATLSLVQAAVGRLPFDLVPSLGFLREGAPLGLLSLDLLLVYGCVAWDTFQNRRVHPAFLWGLAPLLILENVFARPIAHSTPWVSLAKYLVP